MKFHSLKWRIISKESLADLFLLEKFSPSDLKSKVDESDLLSGLIALGYDTHNNPLELPSIPECALIHDLRANDIFSWISTYAAELFPISQYTKVYLLSEWKEITYRDRSDFEFTKLKISMSLSSLIAGEMLSLLEKNTILADISTSRVTACFGMPFSHALLQSHGHFGFSKCIERLNVLHNDGRFYKKSLSLTEIIRIWEKFFSFMERGIVFDSRNASVFARTALKILRFDTTKNQQDFISEESLNLLLSDSIENRVIGFIDLTRKLKGTSISSDLDYPELALAAFLVGRGTSHLSLLNDFKDFSPAIYAWFGLFASMCRPENLDSDWLRLAISIKKILTSDFFSRASDLCWAEYQWLSKSSSASIFDGIQKMSNMAVSVELMPNIVCQFRIDRHESLQKSQKNEIYYDELVRKNKFYEDLLFKFMSVSKDFENFIYSNNYEKYRNQYKKSQYKNKKKIDE